MGSKSSLPHFTKPQKLVTHSQLLCFLKKGWKANRPSLLTTSQDVITASSLLGELHTQGSLHWQSMTVKGDLPEKLCTKLCYCPFCMYSCTNNLSSSKSRSVRVVQTLMGATVPITAPEGLTPRLSPRGHLLQRRMMLPRRSIIVPCARSLLLRMPRRMHLPRMYERRINKEQQT